jgi:pimeloyl-ACP methyl ester carboxylesterase
MGPADAPGGRGSSHRAASLTTLPSSSRATLLTIASGIAVMLVLAIGAGASAALLPDRPWRACPDAVVPIECAALEVPLDHAEPSAGQIRLAVRRLPARDSRQRIGVLVTIAGGPGQRGTDLVGRGRHSDNIEAAFDIISWDSRGTSGETLIDCIPEWDPFSDLDATPDDGAERQALDMRMASLAQHCRERHMDVLPFLGTVQTARDLEALRRWLGEEVISILGTSYGSQVATVYASLFPDRVRAVVLDGYSDPNQSPGDRDVEQAAAFERALDALLAGCAEASDCALNADGDPGLALDRLLARLDTTPVDAGGGRVVTQSDVYEAIASTLLRDDSARQRLLTAIATTAEGDGADLLRIADGSRSAFEASGLSRGTFAAIACADDAAWWQGLDGEQVQAQAEHMQQVAPRLGAWLWSPTEDEHLPPVGLCAMQPDVVLHSDHVFDAAGAGPVLVLATTGDPTTPLTAARRAVDELEDVRLLTVAADHHTAYGPALGNPGDATSACVIAQVEAYIVDLIAPPAWSTCS